MVNDKFKKELSMWIATEEKQKIITKSQVN